DRMRSVLVRCAAAPRRERVARPAPPARARRAADALAWTEYRTVHVRSMNSDQAPTTWRVPSDPGSTPSDVRAGGNARERSSGDSPGDRPGETADPAASASAGYARRAPAAEEYEPAPAQRTRRPRKLPSPSRTSRWHA